MVLLHLDPEPSENGNVFFFGESAMFPDPQLRGQLRGKLYLRHGLSCTNPLGTRYRGELKKEIE